MSNKYFELKTLKYINVFGVNCLVKCVNGDRWNKCFELKTLYKTLQIKKNMAHQFYDTQSTSMYV